MKNFINIGRTSANSDSGNHCIGLNQLVNPKDFKFIFEDGSYVIIPNKVIMNYIKNHKECWRTGCWIKDEFGEKSKWVPAEYILIPDEYILSYSA